MTGRRPRIEIVSASAGSGKTYRLAEILRRAIEAGECRPDAVLATTFTRKAAAELQERARRFLLEAGRTSDAHLLSAARIGTVHAVCGRLVAEFAYELELSPALSVLDEASAEAALRASVSRVLTPAQDEELSGLSHRMGDFEWQFLVRRVVELARTNDMTMSALKASLDRSIEEMMDLLDPATEDLDGALESALRGLLSGLQPEDDTTQTTAEYVGRADGALARLSRGEDLPWPEWHFLASKEPGAKTRDLAAPVAAVAARHTGHPLLAADLRRAAELVFGIATAALHDYEARKKRLGAVDFTDQELLCLRLLDRETIRRRLAAQIDLVLVDEFQDTSPIELAVFTRLASLADRSVWVGDQKQAIFGFRGTSPELMDAAIDAIVGSRRVETLPKSYRSRPEMVAITSKVFAAAFAHRGIPPELVELEAEPADEPPGLGPCFEWWQLAERNQGQAAEALAQAATAFLADASVRVRDVDTKVPRSVRPGDVAILCRTNRVAAMVATALTDAGQRAVLPKAGLLDTPEGQLALAGLRLWVDGQDRLAMSVLARLTGFPPDGDAWFDALIAGGARGRGGRSAAEFLKVPAVEGVAAAAGAKAQLAPDAVVDAVLAAVDAREVCLAWGDAEVRLANLDRFRSHAALYTAEAAAHGGGPTVAGLVAYLLELQATGQDDQAVRQADDAVVVATWHQAKGLEWPVTVLFELDRRQQEHPFGLSVVSDGDTFDFRRPLANRWLRYWAHPYSYATTKSTLAARAADEPAARRRRDASALEALRLLYVGWTRARDRLVVTGRGPAMPGALASLVDSEGQPLLTAPEAIPGIQRLRWAGVDVAVLVREAAPGNARRAPPRPGRGYDAPGRRHHPPARVAASGIDARGVQGAVMTLGEELAIVGTPPMDRLGEAVHGFLAADSPSLSLEERRRRAARLLEAWAVEGALAPDDLVTAADRLRAWADSRWPEAVWRREWPLAYVVRPDDPGLPGGEAATAGPGSGTVVAGTADLVIEAPEGVVVVDHKTLPGGAEAAVPRAADYAGQLAAYGCALSRATRRPVVGTYIHLPVQGVVVPVTLTDHLPEAEAPG